jgi:hypothetical protein
MHVAIDNLIAAPGALTSVGDGIASALGELSSSGATATERHLVLLLDGGENEDAFWADVADDVADSGVTIPPLPGRTVDQAWPEIADATGRYHFADDPRPRRIGGVARAYLASDRAERRRTFMDQP